MTGRAGSVITVYSLHHARVNTIMTCSTIHCQLGCALQLAYMPIFQIVTVALLTVDFRIRHKGGIMQR